MEDAFFPGVCTGACCAVLHLDCTLDELRASGETDEDAAFKADMLVPLTLDEARQRAARFMTRRRFVNVRGRRVLAINRHVVEDEEAGHVFKCRQWDEETRLCRAYDRRPAMCRDFPYGDRCSHCGYQGGRPVEGEPGMRGEDA